MSDKVIIALIIAGAVVILYTIDRIADYKKKKLELEAEKEKI